MGGPHSRSEEMRFGGEEWTKHLFVIRGPLSQGLPWLWL